MSARVTSSAGATGLEAGSGMLLFRSEGKKNIRQI